MNQLSSTPRTFRQNQNYSKYIIILLILIGFTARLFPHVPNFTPIGALALFSGLYLSRKWAFFLPLVTMFLSDLVIGFYNPAIMLSVYLSFAAVVGIGFLVKRKKQFSTVLLGTLCGSILFFLTTNSAVWAFGTMYPNSASGLLQSYIMAIPFFKNSLLGDLFYTGVFVGMMEATRSYIKNYQAKKTLRISLHTTHMD